MVGERWGKCMCLPVKLVTSAQWGGCFWTANGKKSDLSMEEQSSDTYWQKLLNSQLSFIPFVTPKHRLEGTHTPSQPSKACCQQTCFSELLFTQFLEASLGICKTEVCSLCFSSRCSQALLFPYGWEVPGTGCCWPKSLHPPAPLAFWEPSYTMSTALVIPQNGLVCLAADRGTAGRQECHKLVQAASFHDMRVAV